MNFWQMLLIAIVADAAYIILASRRKERINVEQLPRASKQIESLVGAGKKIEAIKVYRLDNPGVALKEAKDVIDGITRQQQGLAN